MEQAVGTAEVREQAQDARRQRHRADGPPPREELLGHGERAPSQRASALEHAQHGEGARAGSAQEEIAYRERVEHATPVPFELSQYSNSLVL